MKVLVVGSGAREHAIIWRLSKDINVDEIICLGQNAGVSEIAKTIQVDIEDKIECPLKNLCLKFLQNPRLF